MRLALINILLVLLCASTALATPISDRIISSGPNAGQKLINLVKNHTAGGALFYFYHSSLDRSLEEPVVSGLVF